MPNAHNLIPNSERTPDERRAIVQAGGKASGVARGFKTAIKKCLKEHPELLEEITANLTEEAKSGNMKAVELLVDLNGESCQREMLALKKKELRLKEKEGAKPSGAYSGIPANLIAPAFSGVLFDIGEHLHSEYVFPGGRGSAKSSFVSVNVVDLLMQNAEMHACILRNVGTR